MENKKVDIPKVQGESVWLTQSIYAVPVPGRGAELPVKLVFIGVPVALASVTASLLLGKVVDLESGTFYWSVQTSSDYHYRVTRMPISGTAYAVSVLTCTELMEDVAPASAVEQTLLRKVKEMGLPCLPDWCGYLRENLGKIHIKPQGAYNVPEALFRVTLPDTENFLDFLMQHLEPLKAIAEKGVAA
jgi:hypothetical protein